MTQTNFPNGISSYGVPVLGSDGRIPASTGTYFFVSSGTGAAGNTGSSPSEPLATVAQAISKCTAAKGDVIVLLPGHAETVTATSIALSVSGVQVVGLGTGRLRPTFTFTATGSTITVSADNCGWRNTVLVGNVDNVVTAFTVGAAKNLTIADNEFVDNSDALHFLSCVTVGTTNNAADGLAVLRNFWWGLAIAPAAFLSITGDLDRLWVADNYADMAVTDDEGHFITLTADTIRAARIINNTLFCVGSTGAAVGIFLTGSATDCSGEVSYNRVRSLDTTAELIATAGTGLAFFENYYTGTADASAKLWPVVDAA